MTHAKSVLLVLAVTLAGVALAVGAAGAQELTDDDVAVAVDQADDGSATVTVTANDTAAENATVAVETVDENASYEGTGEYLTDENGTVGLPAPEENVTVAVTAEIDNASATTEVTLTAVEDDNETSFGQLVSAFIDGLKSDNGTEGGIGDAVSEFVLENNPAADKIPGHAGPPENKTGPPEHAGPPSDDDDRRGPPEHAGGDDDEGDDEQEDEDDEDDDEADDEEDDGQGPPDNAGP